MCILHVGGMGHCCYDLGELLVSVDRDTYALISAGVVVRALMMVFELSSLSLPTPKTQISGEVPHAWPDVRITRAETLPSPSLLAGRVNLLKCMESPCDVACPEEAASDGGVKDVDCGLVDDVFGGVVNAKGYE